MSLKLQVVICSTRPGRIGDKVGKWFAEYAGQNSKFDVELIDLADFNLPIYDEAKHPASGIYEKEHTKAWSKTVQRADAYVFVIPEYNYGPPPSFVNALNYVYKEWNYKPCGFVSYGGVSGGLRSAQLAKQLVTTLKIMPMVEGVSLPMVFKMIDDAGNLNSNKLVDKSATDMLVELYKWAQGLSTMRK